MDVRFFLNERIKFVRQFYDTASTPYLLRKHQIEAEEEPYIPPYSEDGEPPFLKEWLEADESLHVLAYLCVSMLAAALHLYFKEWERQSRCQIGESLRKKLFKKGWFPGYRALFSQLFEIKFETAPINYALLEEVVLARNCIEHPPSITNLRTQYTDKDIKKLRHPFFVDEQESSLFSDMDENEKLWFISPTLHISNEQLVTAISEVERFSCWFEVEIETQIYRRYNAQQVNKPDRK
ncbi:MAG: hypothetical protein M0P70_16135 [Desulfobulbaceae bacterium]|nr:hypothetical protein [Desulfobulbaceae bacterium]